MFGLAYEVVVFADMENMPDFVFYAGAFLLFLALYWAVEYSRRHKSEQDTIEELALTYCPLCGGDFGEASATLAAEEFRIAMRDRAHTQFVLQEVWANFWQFEEYCTHNLVEQPIWLVRCPHCENSFLFATYVPINEAFSRPLTLEDEIKWREKIGLPRIFNRDTPN